MKRLCALLLLSVVVAGQQPTKTVDAPTIRTTTRLVQVDVIVTDRNHHPVTDLQAADFTVLENGKAQRVAAFSRQADTGAPPPPPAPLPPDVFTNDPQYDRVSGPLTIVLLDLLNTPVSSRGYVRTAMLEFVAKHLQSGQLVAVFGLSNRLVLLQDVSADPRLLIAAVDRLSGSPRAPVADRSGSEMTEDMLKTNPGVKAIQDLLEVLKRMEAGLQLAETSDRVGITMKAMRAIARAAQRHPGRKSLVWISGSFPFTIYDASEPSILGKEAHLVSFSDAIRSTAAALNDAQVAIYPIDVRGLIDVAPNGDPDRPMGRWRGMNKTLPDQVSTIQDPQASMVELAQQTGGRAFINRNDIATAIAAAVDDAASSYTLGYYPADKNWDGKFRKIQVKLNRSDLHLRHRNGYYAQDPADWRGRGGDRELADALQHDPVTTSSLVFAARIPPPVAGQPVTIEFLVHPASVDFKTEGALHVASLDLRALAFSGDDEDKPAGRSSRTADLRLTSDSYAKAVNSGLRISVSFPLPSGRFRLRLAMRDNHTGNFGTLEAPLTVPKP